MRPICPELCADRGAETWRRSFLIVKDARLLGVCLYLVSAVVFFALSPALGGLPPSTNSSATQQQPSEGGSAGSAGAAEKATRPARHELPEAGLGEAKSLLGRGMLSEAERAARQYLHKQPKSAEGHFLLGYILFREIQGRASQQESAGEVRGHNPDALLSRFSDKQARASLAEFTEGAKYHLPNAFDLKVVALDYVLLRDFVDAEKWLTRSLEWNPKDSEAWYHLGRTKYNLQRFREAIRAFNHCLELDPKNVQAEDNVALSYAGLLQTDEAIAAFRTAIAWQAHSNIKDPGPFLDLGSLLLDQNRVEEAVPYFLQAVEISPRDPRVHGELGKAYFRLKQLAKAQTEMERAVELAPRNAPFHYVLGQIYQKEGLKEKAKLEFDRTAALTAPDSASRSTMH
jgi:tetratricopeptide (TPR) repeat protein